MGLKEMVENELAEKRHNRTIGEKRFAGFLSALRELDGLGGLRASFIREQGRENVSVVVNTYHRAYYVLRLALAVDGQIWLSSYVDGKEKCEPFFLGVSEGLQVLSALIANKLAENSRFTLGVK